MRNHPFVWHSGAAGERTKRSRAALVVASALTVAFLPAAIQTATAAAGPSEGSAGKPPLSIVSVKVINPNTVDTTFSNPMDPAKLDTDQFQAPHYYWVIPHTHIAVAFGMRDGNRTIRTVLDRALHPRKDLCDSNISQDDPRCSTDTLEWEIEGATDKYGQKINNKDWKVWENGSKKHPDACRPGCP